MTGLTAVLTLQRPTSGQGRTPGLCPPIHPECALRLERLVGEVPCKSEWQEHIRRSLDARAAQIHVCPLAMRCSCIPLYYREQLVGVAKCVAPPSTSSRRFTRAVKVLDLLLAKACQDLHAHEQKDRIAALEKQVVQLQTLRRTGLARSRPTLSRRGEDATTASFTAAATGSSVERALHYVSGHYLDPRLGLARISRAVGVSEKHLTHTFTRVVGGHMRAHIRHLRVQHACALLLSTDQPVKRIAFESGFRRVEVFRRAFRRVVGASPTTYRRAMAQT